MYQIITFILIFSLERRLNFEQVDWRRVLSNLFLGSIVPVLLNTIFYKLILEIIPIKKAYISFLWVFIILEFVTFLLHFLYHKNKYLWKIHRIHHKDNEVDTSSTFRFHPFEMIMHFVITSIVAIAIGASWEDKMKFDMILFFAGMFHHSKDLLPKKIDTILSKIFVTPGYHLYHHSADKEQYNYNYCSLFNFWDLVFNTRYKGRKEVLKVGSPGRKDQENFIDLIEDPFIN